MPGGEGKGLCRGWELTLEELGGRMKNMVGPCFESLPQAACIPGLLQCEMKKTVTGQAGFKRAVHLLI